jgi:ion channel POLLUX/CASTOR
MKISWMDKLRYRFDNFMSKGPIALIAGLGGLSLTIIVVMAALVWATQITPEGAEPLSFMEAAWVSLMRTLDAGTMGGDAGWSFRIAMFVVTLGGVFVISTLIGILTSGIEGKIEKLSKGRSRVLESNHTVILGWSPKIFAILSELIIANQNQAHACIVILGEKDKVEMEDEIKDALGSAHKMRIVCRTGSPINLNDLNLVNVQASKAVIVLAHEDEDPDAQTIKTILAIVNNPLRRPAPYHVVAEIRDEKNLEIAQIVGKNEVEFVETSLLIARITAQTCRQSGLSVVYTELLDFGGDEIYFKAEPALVGKTFAESLTRYRASSIIGIYNQRDGVRLNPPMHTQYAPGDQIVAISADDDTIVLDAAPVQPGPEKLPAASGQKGGSPERTLILGWNSKAPRIIMELDQYVPAASEVLVVAQMDEAQTAIENISGLNHLQVHFQNADTTDRRVLEEICPLDYHHTIVLSYSDSKEIQAADACTLITLLHLRDMAEKHGRRSAVVSEILDLHNRTLAEVTQADDFIVSDRLISLIMTQIAENKALNAVFKDLFDPEGSEIYLKPADQYVPLGTPVDFYTVTAAAVRQGQVAFGYRLKAQANDAAQSYGVEVNPDKANKVTFSAQDRIIVLSEN